MPGLLHGEGQPSQEGLWSRNSQDALACAVPAHRIDWAGGEDAKEYFGILCQDAWGGTAEIQALRGACHRGVGPQLPRRLRDVFVEL